MIHILYKYYHSRKRRFDYFENKNKFRELVKDKIKHKYGLVGWLAGLWYITSLSTIFQLHRGG